MAIVAVLVASLILLGLSIFQVLIIFGMHLGHFAWGGKHEVLTKNLRISSGVSIILYLVFAVFLLSKSGMLIIISDKFVVDLGTWIITGYLFLGLVMNFISKSKKEKASMTLIALLLALSFLIITLS